MGLLLLRKGSQSCVILCSPIQPSFTCSYCRPIRIYGKWTRVWSTQSFPSSNWMSRMYAIEQFLFFAPSEGNPRQSKIRIPRRGFSGTWILDSLYNKWDSGFLDCIPDSTSTLSTLLYSAFQNKNSGIRIFPYMERCFSARKRTYTS